MLTFVLYLSRWTCVYYLNVLYIITCLSYLMIIIEMSCLKNESNKSGTKTLSLARFPVHSWRTDVKPICDIGLLDLSQQSVIVGQTEKHFPVGSSSSTGNPRREHQIPHRPPLSKLAKPSSRRALWNVIVFVTGLADPRPLSALSYRPIAKLKLSLLR